MPATAPVSIIGLGRMGSVIAEWLGRTHPLLGWDVREEATADRHNLTAAAPTAIAQSSKIILLCLPSPKETAQVVENQHFLAKLSSQSVVVDMSTSDPTSARRFFGELSRDGCPFFGRPHSRSP